MGKIHSFQQVLLGKLDRCMHITETRTHPHTTHENNSWEVSLTSLHSVGRVASSISAPSVAEPSESQQLQYVWCWDRVPMGGHLQHRLSGVCFASARQTRSTFCTSA